MARTIDAKFYCFDIFFNEKLKLFDCLSDIMDICCNHHLLAFTNKGEVYAWIWNHFQLIQMMELILQRYQIKIDRFDGQKLISISRGFSHSIALTESGRVFSWNQINSFNKFELHRLTNKLWIHLALEKSSHTDYREYSSLHSIASAL